MVIRIGAIEKLGELGKNWLLLFCSLSKSLIGLSGLAATASRWCFSTDNRLYIFLQCNRVYINKNVNRFF